MAPLLPSSCTCYTLQLPVLNNQFHSTDELSNKRLTLNHRIGAASILTRSTIFIHGGLTILLNITDISLSTLQRALTFYFSHEKDVQSYDISHYISKEIFFLDLITRKWERLDVHNSISNSFESMSERLFHSMCYYGGCIYIFGGLIPSKQSNHELVVTNELWRLDLINKKWTLLNSDPRITMRFNHSMHVSYGCGDQEQPRLVVMGGLNNLDQPIYKVDIYNLRQNSWEFSGDTDGSQDNIYLNIDGEFIGVTGDSNVSFLTENNFERIPSLTFYSTIQNRNDISQHSSLITIPLIPGSLGERMHTYSQADITEKRLKLAFNLLNPTGGIFGRDLVVSGYCPDRDPNNFHLFLYNTTSGKWTRINLSCHDMDTKVHRFWKTFIWESHHKAVILGSDINDNCSPLVQKFDKLLSLGLHTVNIFHASQYSSRQRIRQGFPPQTSFPVTPEKSTSQHFENYSKYVAPPSEITSITSVFPSYAMALGKDALEVYGKSLADFEFITEEGDSIGIPNYLLRKRWGRFFDKLLAHGYNEVCSELDNNSLYSDFIKSSPRSVSNTFLNSNQGGDTNQQSPHGSKESLFVRQRSSHQLNTYPFSHKRSLFCASSNSNKSGLFQGQHEIETTTDDNSPLLPVSSNEFQNKLFTEPLNSVSLTSSSGDMVFRVPFQDNSTHPKHLYLQPFSLPFDRKSKEKSDSSIHRRFSFCVGLDQNRKLSVHRRLSHPIIRVNSDIQSITSNYKVKPILSPPMSRNTSINFLANSISHSNSNSIKTNNDYINNYIDLALSSPLPHLEPTPPTDPLPSIPFNTGLSYGKRISDSEINSSISSRSSSISQSFSTGSMPPNDISRRTNSPSLPLFIHHQQKDDSTIDFVPPLSVRNKPLPPIPTRENSVVNNNKRASLVPTIESVGSQFSNILEQELDPSLMLRSLYMPWGTSTIRALSEFFYTGQVNGKWPLSPVSLDLFSISKLYEIPLLYDLISEVLYSILGKKEESMVIMTTSLKELFLRKVSAHFLHEEEKLESYLGNNTNYKDLKALQRSLDTIDDGYFDINILRKTSTALSVNTDESDEVWNLDKLFLAETNTPSASNIPTLFAGGPRDSLNSNLSIGFPPTLNLSSFRKSSYVSRGMPYRNKLSLCKDVTPNFRYDNYRDKIGTVESENLTKSYDHNTFDGLIIHSKSLEERKQDTDETLLEPLDNIKLSNLDKLRQSSSSANYILYSKLNEAEMEAENDVCIDDSKNILLSENKRSDESTSSSEDDEFDLGLGLISPDKSNQQANLCTHNNEHSCDSIDPLVKLSTSDSRSNILGLKYTPKNISDQPLQCLSPPTLDSLASPNALPPMDFIIDLIYEVSVLVNDIKLMVRCMSCNQLSKSLKSIKNKLIQDIADLEGLTKVPEKQPSTTESKLPSGKCDDTPIQGSTVDKISKEITSITLQKPKATTESLLRRNTTVSAGNLLSAQTSPRGTNSFSNIMDFKTDEKSTKSFSNISQTSSKPKRSPNYTTSSLVGASIFMASPFGQFPQNKKKKNSVVSSASSASSESFSLFGIKK